MSRPEDIPEWAWDAVKGALLVPDEHEYDAMDVEVFSVLARVLLAAEQRGAEREREACETAIEKANERVSGIKTPLMRGDNLAVTLCTHFDDGGGDEDDTGWCAAATEGYHEVVAAIREHYANAIRGRKA